MEVGAITQALADMLPANVWRWIDLLGYAAAILNVGTFSMKRMIPLRICSLCASSLFMIYGLLLPSYPTFALHIVLFPLNSIRLYQMTKLVEQVRTASQADLSMDWLRPFSQKQTCKAGEMLFRKGDTADRMYYVLSGRYRLSEIGIDVGPGAVIGEIGLVEPELRRTQSFECLEGGDLLTMSYDKVREIYFQNPQFGFYFLKLVARRLLANAERLETELETMRGGRIAPA